MVEIGRGRGAQKTLAVKFPWEFTDADAKKLPTDYAMTIIESCASHETKEFAKYVVYAYCKTHQNAKKKDMSVLIINAMKWYFTEDFLFSEYAEVVENVHQHDFGTWKRIAAIRMKNNLHITQTPTLISLRKIIIALKKEAKICSKK